MTTDQDKPKPNKKCRDVAQKIADLLDEEGITDYEARANTMLVATVNACGIRGYQWIVDNVFKPR